MKNEAYWNPKRIPKTDRLTLMCAPEDSRRTAALLSNAVDMIETPPPDAVDRLKQSGMKIETNVTPHVWNYHLSQVEGSPWTDIRLRRAANLAVDRDLIVKLMHGLAKTRLWRSRQDQPVVRQAHVRDQVCAGRGAQAHDRRRFQQGRPAQDQVRHRLAAAAARCCRCR